MNNLFIPLVVVCLLIASGPAYPQQGPGGPAAPPVISWDYVMRAVEGHPLFGVGRGRVAQSEGELVASREYPNPEASLSSGQSRAVEGGERETTYSAEVLFPVEWASIRRPRIKAAEAGTAAGRAEAVGLRLEAIYDLKTIFLKIARDQEMLERLYPFRDEYARLVDMTRLRVESGEARPSDLGRMQAEFERFQIELAKIESQASANRRALDQWLGKGLPADFRVDFDLTEMPELPPREDALVRAGNANPKIQGGQAKVTQAEAVVEMEQAKRSRPALSLGAAYGREFDTTNVGVVAVIGLPIFNRNQGAVAAARGERDAAGSELEYRVNQVEQKVSDTLDKAIRERKAALSYSESILPRTDKNVQAMEKMYIFGEVSLLDMIDTRRVNLETRLAYVSLLAEFHLARARLLLLMGEQ
jgi:outer membrane protein, heavy metal efflux system